MYLLNDPVQSQSSHSTFKKEYKWNRDELRTSTESSAR